MAGWPLGAAGGVAVTAAVLAVRDPHRPGSYGYCPIKLFTGLNCPFCGGLRAVHDLAHGDLPAAAGDNLAVLLLLVAAAGWWLLWLRRGGGLGPGSLPGVPGWLVWVGAAGLVVFTVLRNLSFGGALAP